jgi:bile acid-coenzyme A ligase
MMTDTSSPRTRDERSLAEIVTSVHAARGDVPAIIALRADGGEQTVSWRELATRVQAAAAAMRSAGVGPTTTVTVALPNGVAPLVLLLAGSLCGATVVPCDPRAPAAWLERVLRDRPGPQTAITPTNCARVLAPGPSRGRAGEPFWPAAIPGGYCTATGGSSGAPRLVAGLGGMTAAGFAGFATLLRAAGWRPRQRQLVAGPLWHAAPLRHALAGLLDGGTLLVAERFEPARLRALLAAGTIEWCQLTPHQMRLLELPRHLRSQDLHALAAVLHTSAPCPPDLKRAWIALLGAERVMETYGSSEMVGTTLISGDEWLRRPGSVGRGFATQLLVLDAAGRPLPPGDVGEVYMRSPLTRRYQDQLARSGLASTPAGFFSVGDLGSLDEDGYLFLAGRRGDVVNVGGAKVSTREVVDVVLQHDAVLDAVVHGHADELYGAVLAATVQLDARAPATAEELAAHCRARLPRVMVPRRWKLTTGELRGETGKLRRDLRWGSR